MMSLNILRGSLFLILMSAFIQVESRADKVSAAIHHHQAIKKKPANKSTADHTAFLYRKGVNPENLDSEDCALYVNAPLSESDKQDLAAGGIMVHESYVPPLPPGHPLGFYLATVSYGSLDQVETDDRIARLDSAEYSSQPQNDIAKEITNVEDVHDGIDVLTARDGTGVTIAIADSGFDINHPDLPAPIEKYDMTDGTDTTTWGTDVSNHVTGHGTHVAGSALGRGTNSGGQYSGSAPGASALYYKIGGDVSSSAFIIDEVEAIVRAGVAGADIFTMSYGGLGNFNDGSSAMCQAIDIAFSNGMVVCISAGNDADDEQHDSIDVVPGTTSAQFNLKLPADEDAGEEDLSLIWSDPGGQYNPSSAANDIVLNCTNLGAGEALTKNYGVTSSRDTDSQSWTLDTNTAGAAKTYNFTITNNLVAGDTPTIHCFARDLSTWDSPDMAYTVTNPSVADEAICVGAWVHRASWDNWTGNGYSYGQAAGGIAGFSSRGPRIDGANYPTVSSPGSAMISTRDDPYQNNSALRIDDDGSNDGTGPTSYYVLQGTSMACPFAAGMCALLIQEKPEATPTQIRNGLIEFASSAGAPDNDVGHGLFDAILSINNVVPVEFAWFDLQ